MLLTNNIYYYYKIQVSITIHIYMFLNYYGYCPFVDIVTKTIY